MTSEQELIWLAGFFDGEGSINFAVAKKTNVIYPRAQIVNTNIDNAKKLKEIFLKLYGKEARWQHKQQRDGYRPIWEFRVKNQEQLRVLLKAMLPYLVGKKPQAELMLEYLDKTPGKGGSFRAEHYEIVDKMRLMNKRYGKGEWQGESSANDLTISSQEVEETEGMK